MTLTPYKGSLVDLRVSVDKYEALNNFAKDLPAIRLSERATHDLELLAIGAFSPLHGFMGQADYESVLETMRLSDGTLFPMPITLPVDADAPISLDTQITLRTRRNSLLAIMTVEEIYEWDIESYAQNVLGTTDTRHPLVSELYRWGRLNIAGQLQVLRLPPQYDFPELRLTPAEVRHKLRHQKYVVGFQSRNPMNRAHEAMLKHASEDLDASLLLQPIIGLTNPNDIDHYTRVRAYTTLLDDHLPQDKTLISLLPLALRWSGEREALWQAIIARNYGVTHLPIGRNHANPFPDSDTDYNARDLVKTHESELGVKVLPYREWVYLPEDDRYADSADLAEHQQSIQLSSKAMRRGYLDKGKKLPAWFVRPEVADILAQAYPPKHERGICIWFTGLSGAGKSTTASILSAKLRAHGRQVTLLDGDIVRTNLSRGLGFSKADRDTNVRRIGFVASEIVRHGGVAICAAVSPYRATRADVRSMVGEGFIEVFVDTPLEVCEARDSKGLYAKARRGQIKGFTGIDDPYEAPDNADIHLKTTTVSPDMNAQYVLDYLIEQAFIQPL